MKETNQLPVAPIDLFCAKANPWKLTPTQCCAMRLVCKHGSIKQVWAEAGITLKSIQYHVETIRSRMGFRGHDVRVYLQWHQWYVDFNSDRSTRAKAKREAELFLDESATKCCADNIMAK